MSVYDYLCIPYLEEIYFISNKCWKTFRIIFPQSYTVYNNCPYTITLFHLFVSVVILYQSVFILVNGRYNAMKMEHIRMIGRVAVQWN